ncbi:MAG: hydrogenase [Deltaproteobacteria bacterium]|nr:hydrogenase [Deltaproteobacteria bacterium]MBW2661010.1 hydrogenase [Deltaproteobacteria bacterium]
MILFLVAIIVLFAGAVLLPLMGRSHRANIIGPAFSAAGAVIALAGSLTAIQGRGWDFVLPWNFQMGTLHLKMDPLSAYFSAVISLISAVVAVYGGRYMDAYAGKKNLGAAWSLFMILVASMLLLTTAWNGVLFLIIWEIMSLSSFFLVIFESERPEVLRAGWIYLVAAHLGTACLLVMFIMMGTNHSFDFDVVNVSGAGSVIIFVLAMAGFGTKAGFLPFHVWLPEAHPSAPSHVSAVMSGVMIKTGIYGILRICFLLGAPQMIWGWSLICVGVVTGVVGVLFALAQHDLKRLLAYHSVENIGIIAIGLGLGFLGLSTGHPVAGVLGITGGLLHVLNHAVFKSLLFLGAGSVLHATHTLDIEKMGGLMKRMPVTGTTFLLASAAICALPPLNGFVSEFLIYLGSFASLYGSRGSFDVLGSIIVISALALIGGLAVACFSKAVGIVFLGEPRTREAAAAKESGISMGIPMMILSALCVFLGIGSPFVIRFIRPAIEIVTGDPSMTESALNSAIAPLYMVSMIGIGIVCITAILIFVRRWMLRKRNVSEGVTWDCGYTSPTTRMQYTASSFADPITNMYRVVLQPKKHLHSPEGLFPVSASIETHTDDVFVRYIYAPVFAAITWVASSLHWLQRGYNQLYILYIVLTLLSLLVWIL